MWTHNAPMGTERTQEASVAGTLLTVGSVNTGSCQGESTLSSELEYPVWRLQT